MISIDLETLLIGIARVMYMIALAYNGLTIPSLILFSILVIQYTVIFLKYQSKPPTPIRAPVPITLVTINPVPSTAILVVHRNNVWYYVDNTILHCAVVSGNIIDRWTISLPSIVIDLQVNCDRIWLLTSDGSVYHIGSNNDQPKKINIDSIARAMTVTQHQVMIVHENGDISSIGSHSCHGIDAGITLAERNDLPVRSMSTYYLSPNGKLWKLNRDVVFTDQDEPVVPVADQDEPILA